MWVSSFVLVVQVQEVHAGCTPAKHASKHILDIAGKVADDAVKHNKPAKHTCRKKAGELIRKHLSAQRPRRRV